MTKFVILFFTIFLILNNVIVIVNSSPLKKRHGPFLPCEGNYPNIISNVLISPDKLAYGQQVFVKFTGYRTVPINSGAVCEIAIQRDDGLPILQTNTDFCNNSIGINCPLGPGDTQIGISFPMPLNGQATTNQTDTTIHKYSMAFSSKLFILLHSLCLFILKMIKMILIFIIFFS
jgi:hypothetical protein